MEQNDELNADQFKRMRSENDNKYRRQMPRMEMHLHLTVEKYKLIGTDNI